MKVKKYIMGLRQTIELELELIKEYERYGLYQVYDISNGKHKPLYKTCYTDLQIKDIVLSGYCINEEAFE